MEQFWNYVLVDVLCVANGFWDISLTVYDVIIIHDGYQYHIVTVDTISI